MSDFLKNRLQRRESELFDLLKQLGQSHLFNSWRPEDDEDRRKAFFAQAERLDGNYPGGLAGYVKNARRLLLASKRGGDPYAGFVPEVPSCRKLDVETAVDEYEALERIGMDHIGDAAFVLVAGGLGERLGFSGVKVALPVETTTDKSYLQYYIEYILAFQSRARRHRDDRTLTLPLMLMTSDDTHEPTQKFLDENAYFGMNPDQVTLLRQEKVACLADNHARLAPADDDPYLLQTKPHGHGDVHTLLHQSGLAKRWLDSGKRWLFFFQDTNGLSFRGFAAALGVSVQDSLDMNFLAVPRVPEEAIGAVAKLRRPADFSLTANVEYNELARMLEACGHEAGDVADASGFSPFPGNINILVFGLSWYCKTLQRTAGAIPELVNPKYKDDETRDDFIRPTRLECLMQDIAKSATPDAKIGVTQMNRWLIFSPVKNSLTSARKLDADGLPVECAASGEMDIYGATNRLLRICWGNRIAAEEQRELGGIHLPVGPRIVYSPSFATTVQELRAKIRGLKIARNSTLVIEGRDIEVEDLDLDGTLIVRAVDGAIVRLQGLWVRNQGWPIRDLDPNGDDDEVDRMRGYLIDRDERRATVLEFPMPGVYTPSQSEI